MARPRFSNHPKGTDTMRAIEIARRLAELGNIAGALKAYRLVLQEEDGDPAEKLEAAAYFLQHGGDYRVAYTAFVQLYNGGFAKDDCLSILTQGFYEPNVKLMKTRYEKNCKRLAKYPYLFRKDFPAFEALPIRFYPFDDNGYVPFYPGEERFGDYVRPRNQVISRNFFRDLEKPILATDVFSQYELEYLNDNVRKSEWVARENHIYLHYSDWGEFCAWLQVLNLRPLTEEKKVVFLMEDELSQYPIDFKERFGIDYSQYRLKPVGIREINRLIWHTQLSSHNGGDFFNEVFDGHPNLICLPSLMLDDVEDGIAILRKSVDEYTPSLVEVTTSVFNELLEMKNPTDKDYLIGLYLGSNTSTKRLDRTSRIVPAMFFQPHFHNVVYDLKVVNGNQMELYSPQYEHLCESEMIQGFKYIKTFTPMRRFTTSHGATVKFMFNAAVEREGGAEDGKLAIVNDALMQRVMNRSFMVDWQDRLYKDSVLVRFEDGKLNPKATFTALAGFLDVPYTESMTYCSLDGEIDPESLEGNVRGFDTAAVYRTYDEYINDAERYFIEYFLRDAYEYYGYGFQCYDGKSVDAEKMRELMTQFERIDYYIRKSWEMLSLDDVKITKDGEEVDLGDANISEQVCDGHMESVHENREYVVGYLMQGMRFINRHGQPLHMMPKLKLDEALLEQPLYH